MTVTRADLLTRLTNPARASAETQNTVLLTSAACADMLEAKAEIERLQAVLKECSDDLAAELNVRYHKTLDYPSQRRAYDRDMVPVIEARKLLGLEQKAGE